MVASSRESNGAVEELNITVAVRCRGRNEREIKAKSSVVVSVPDVTGSNEVSINTTGDVGIAAQINSKTYTVDEVFGPSANQSLIFHKIAEPLFADFIKGYNCTVLVYGMTSTGKTYTMTGDEKLYDGELSESAGIIPRVLFKLFESLENEDYVVKCSFVELYNEELKDLLSDSQDFSSSARKLRIFDSSTLNGGTTSMSNNSSRKSSRNNSPRSSSELSTATFMRKRWKNNMPTSNGSAGSSVSNGNSNKSQSLQGSQDQNAGIYIQNLQDFHITTAKEGIKLLQKGLKHRQVATTKMNDFSSRSHTIFTITLYKEYHGELFRVSKMNLVDLAGSENISRSGAQHQRAKEAGSINQSLLTLGRVINSLADKSLHVPFRESKLTRLLQDSLGGNTKTALIATISPAKINSEETCSTLQYAAKAKNIKNKPQLGSVIMKDILVKSITAELAKIKADLLSTKTREGIYMSQDNYKELTNDLDSYRTEVQEYKRAIETLTSQNTLLLKDKKASNEVNDLQRIKLQNMKDSISELHARIDRQNRREQNLVNMASTLRTTLNTMQTILSEREKKEKDLKENINRLIASDFAQVREMIDKNFQEIQNNIKLESAGIQPNIDSIKEEIRMLLETAQEHTDEVYKDCVEKVSGELPALYEAASERITEVEAMVGKCYRDLSENLSDASEEYNNFKQYLNDHFFKNNHEELLASHVDRTYHHIQASGEDLFQKFKEMMDNYLENNKHLMLNSLRTATCDVIEKEMQLFEPQKDKWESSFKYINNCDALNIALQKDIKSPLSDFRSTLQTSRNMIEQAMTKVKKRMSDHESPRSALSKNQTFNQEFSGLLNKENQLQEGLKKSLQFTDAYGSALDQLQASISSAVGDDDHATDKSRPENIDGVLRRIDEQNVLYPDRSPLKSTSFRVNKSERSSPNKSSPIKANSHSPCKPQLSLARSGYKRSYTDLDGTLDDSSTKVTRHH
ncbi:hypothetical protein HG536_0H04630 [Torulaspora globosa]|uniref:Kinesin-like protein n=1 Tax=Torulaspora globosa TaxID=48254 RepID=A0A7G3ZNK1_9SACH|nr:uncharacterized protein HG536_0H04630 [Torulaspora globosa]QLL35087.1 hypothetical protein HG536_0H04630 [Torulaspora globosa]